MGTMIDIHKCLIHHDFGTMIVSGSAGSGVMPARWSARWNFGQARSRKIDRRPVGSG